jgi:hypothetical protein
MESSKLINELIIGQTCIIQAALVLEWSMWYGW